MSESQVYRGISLPFGQATFSPYSEIDYERFKKWNLNSVQYVAWWGGSESSGGIEPWEDKPRVYNESALNDFEIQLALARKYGLYPFLSLRVSYQQTTPSPLFAGWPDIYGADLVNLNEAGRDRYCNMLKMIAQRFPNLGINTWHFPYHGQSDLAIEQIRMSTYYNITQPALYMAVRSVSNSPIILTPMLQGIKYESGMAGLEDQPYYPDKKVYYGVNTHDRGPNYLYGGIAMKCSDWDYDYDSLNAYYQPTLIFKELHPNSKIICTENIALDIHDDCPTRPIKQSRLDWMIACLEKQKELDMGWFYWRYENPPSVESPIELDGSDNAVSEIISKYAPTPISALSFLFKIIKYLGPLGAVLYLIRKKSKRRG